MNSDAGNLSIDFLIGFTIFMLAFIWVATMIPGLLLGVNANAIDYDAVAYRTGVILVEDPGYTVTESTSWEKYGEDRNDEIARIGMALTKNTPNILSVMKINRTFSPMFTYPEDYQQKVIFGDLPYQFNVSLMSFDGTYNRSIGDPRPSGYGYIRRVVRIKEVSNATVDAAQNPSYDMAFDHLFSVEMNLTHLLEDEKRPEYQINPEDETVTINLTGLKAIRTDPGNTKLYLRSANLSIRYAGDTKASGLKPDFLPVYIDKKTTMDKPTTAAPVEVDTDVSMIFPGSADLAPLVETYKQSTLYVNFTFVILDAAGTTNPFFWTPVKDYCINSTAGAEHFEYNYNASRVTQPELKPAVVEVAVW